MGSRWKSVLPRGEPLPAARGGAALFALSGLLALVAIPTRPADDTRTLVLIALADAGITAVALLAPWQRWGVWSVALLSLPGCAVLAVSTWAFGGFAAGTGPFFVLLFVWLGLYQTSRVILAVAPVAAVAYAGGLIAAGADQPLVGTTAVLIPIAVAVGLVISTRVRHLDSARARIEQQERWRGALMATLAHDVRTPLTTIDGGLEILEDDPDLPEHLRPVVATARRQSSRLSSLSRNLLESERIDEGKLRLELDDVDVLPLVHHVAELLDLDDEQLQVDVAPGVHVRADRMRLEQMLVNLLTNAMRHGVPPIVIGVHVAQQRAVISVRDHGAGVPEHDQALLFVRLSPSDRSPHSVGLGLWIVKMLAEAHHGGVAYRTADPGAEFTIELPHPARA